MYIVNVISPKTPWPAGDIIGPTTKLIRWTGRGTQPAERTEISLPATSSRLRHHFSTILIILLAQSCQAAKTAISVR